MSQDQGSDSLAGSIPDFDHFSEKTTIDPDDLWARLRRVAPVIRSEKYGGFYVVSRYEDVARAFNDWETYSSKDSNVIPPFPAPLWPIHLDPPAHRSGRTLLNPHFAPAAMEVHEPWIRDLAREHLERLPADGVVFDMCEAFVSPYVQTIACRLVGMPDDDLPYIDSLLTHLLEDTSVRDGTDESGSGAKLSEYMQNLMAERKAGAAKNDLLQVVVDAEFEGAPLGDMEKMLLLQLLLLGGLHTTIGAIGGMLVWLADHPEDQDQLRKNPELMKPAIEEFVRFTSPATYISRTCVADTEIAGCPIKPEDRVMLNVGSANRDPSKFEHPDEILLDRHPNHHAAFGMGPHRCVGSHLAKLEMRVALEEMLTTFATFTVADHHFDYSSGEARSLRKALFTVTR